MSSIFFLLSYDTSNNLIVVLIFVEMKEDIKNGLQPIGLFQIIIFSSSLNILSHVKNIILLEINSRMGVSFKYRIQTTLFYLHVNISKF